MRFLSSKAATPAAMNGSKTSTFGRQFEMIFVTRNTQFWQQLCIF
jgi:hypothetical protein